KDQSEKITISPKIYINKTGMLEARVKSPNVNSSGIYQTDTVFDGGGKWHFRESDNNRYSFKGMNLQWELPDFSSGFDFDFPIGRSTSITGGLQYSVKNGTGLTGGSLGLGFFNIYENSAFRFSFGLNLQEYLFDAQTIVVTRVMDLFGSGPEETTILFYHDIDKCSKLNYYMSMTFNTNNENLPVNFFLGGSYFGQSLLSFKPSNPNKEFYPWGVKYTTDTRSEASTSFASLSPGIYLRLSEYNRLLVGANIMMEMGGLTDISQQVMVVPFIKMDFLL
ncbi:MAG: hypothetical protein ACM3Q2_08300, partial [Syntrophothermus sp.]